MSTATRSDEIAMDERIAHRRAEVRDGQRRRRRRWIGSALGLVLLLGAGAAVAASPLFAITDVHVQGVDGEDAVRVREAAAIEPGGNLLTADVGRAAAAVRSLAWVREAQVVRVPPATVEVRVRPREPFAAVRLAGESWTLDTEGVILHGGTEEGLVAIDAPNSALPRTGQAASDAAILNAIAFHDRLPDALAQRVARYEAPSATGLRMLLEAGEQSVWVRVGTADDAELKAEVIGTLLGQADRLLGPDGPGVEALDVRAPENPVLVPAAGP